MKIFLSYASEDRATAQAIQLALCAQGHDVFFDREDLPPGEEYHARIRRAIGQSDLFIFLVSASALDAGSYTLTELEIAGNAWKHPAGRLLPVLLSATPLERIPVLLKAVTLLQPEGNVPASVAHAVHRLATAHRRSWLIKGAVASLAVVSIAAAGVVWWRGGRGGEGMVMIPAGVFTMGDDENAPRREIYVDDFHLDRDEVTVARYRQFLEATGAVNAPEGWETVDFARDRELPVTGVDWHDASAYCAWAGKRLPTEAEWEKAARGIDARMYPWGDASPMYDLANFQNYSPGAYEGGLAAVGTHPAGDSPYGIHDLAGNAAEWVADWYSESVTSSDVRNPGGPDSGTGKVIRGGGFRETAEHLRASARFHASPQTRSEDVGFRCAQ